MNTIQKIFTTPFHTHVPNPLISHIPPHMIPKRQHRSLKRKRHTDITPLKTQEGGLSKDNNKLAMMAMALGETFLITM